MKQIENMVYEMHKGHNRAKYILFRDMDGNDYTLWVEKDEKFDNTHNLHLVKVDNE